MNEEQKVRGNKTTMCQVKNALRDLGLTGEGVKREIDERIGKLLEERIGMIDRRIDQVVEQKMRSLLGIGSGYSHISYANDLFKKYIDKLVEEKVKDQLFAEMKKSYKLTFTMEEK